MIFCHDNDDCVGTENCELDTTQNRLDDYGKSYSIDMNLIQYEELTGLNQFSLNASSISNT